MSDVGYYKHLLDLYAQEQAETDKMLDRFLDTLTAMSDGRKMIYTTIYEMIAELEQWSAGRQARETWGKGYEPEDSTPWKEIYDNPTGMSAYLAVVGAYSQEHRLDLYKFEITYAGMHHENPRWYVYEQDRFQATIEFHGKTKSGNLKFRIFHELFQRRKWHTVIFPISQIGLQENEPD